jgi:YD repeat-containing protein
MSYIIGISVDSQGNLYVTDWAGNHVREVAASTTETIQPAPSTLSALYPAPGSTTGTTTYPGGITITQPGGAQITFYTPAGTSCSSPYVMAGQYCALPEDIGASLTFSASTSDYTFTPQPGTTYTYNSGGTLLSETDAAGNALMLSYGSPVPGSGNCPSAANWCETLTSASGRAETIGYNASGMVTSVIDPMGRRWTYAYNSSSQLTSATDPMGNVTSYSYSAGTTGNPLNANNLTTITDPNEQSGGPDAGTSTSITYNAAGQVTSQTDPMGFTTSYTWAGFNPATGYGIITVADPDGNKAVYDYVQGTLAAQSAWTGTTLTSEQDYVPDQTASSSDNSAGTQLETATADGNGNITAISYNTDGRPTPVTAPSGDGQPGTSTSAYTSSLQVQTCAGSNEASPSNSCTQNAGPAIVAAGTSASPRAITPPSSAPPVGLTYTRYDSNGNALYMTTGVYPPNGSTASYQRTTYRLFNYDSVTLPGSSTATSCTYAAPSPSLPCTTINADGVVSQLEYNSAGDLILSSTPDGNSGGQLATATYGYDTDGEQTSVVSADGNVSGMTPQRPRSFRVTVLGIPTPLAPRVTAMTETGIR